ncbi:hypothetical protein ACKFKG_22350 [Phormidesmis sp. 146-35]
MLPSLGSREKAQAELPTETKRVAPIGPFAFLLGMSIIFVAAYISHERAFYWFDYVTYEWILDKLAVALQASPLPALRSVWRSTGSDYSDYPTLLLLPFRWVFGDSRLVYIIGVSVLYSVPFGFVLGAIATKLIRSANPRTVWWSGALIAIVTPLFWAPTLRGYVDAGAALLIAIAVWVYLQDVTLRYRWQIGAIGFLLGFTPLFRRHFAYAGIAFFAAMVIQAVIRSFTLRQQPRQAIRILIGNLTQIGLIGLVSVATIAILGKHFLLRVLHNDFTSLYASFEVPLTQALQFYGISFGWVAWLLAALGFTVGLKTRVLARPATTFVLLFYGILCLVWVAKVRQLTVHYTLHFTPLVILGLIAFGWTVWLTLDRSLRRIGLALFVTYLSLNALMGLAPVDFLDQTPLRPTRFGMTILPETIGAPLSELFAANNPPLRRSDYAEIARLIGDLRSKTPNGEPIYVGESSSIINPTLLMSAETILHHQKSLNFLSLQDVDSRDSYPLKEFLQADYIAVATPFQYNIRPEDQDLVRLVGRVFSENWQIAQDFKQLPETYQLEKQVKVNLYQRQRSTSLNTAIATFETMKAFMGSRPGGQLDWIVTSRIPGYYLWGMNGVYNLKTNPLRPTRSTAFLYINPLPKSSAQLTGQIVYDDRQCPGIEIRLSGVDRSAQTIQIAKLDHGPAASSNFSLSIPTQNAGYLLLELNNKSATPEDLKRCTVTASSLQVSSN